MIRLLKQYLAKRALAKDVKRRRNSYEIISYRKHRDAALKAIRG